MIVLFTDFGPAGPYTGQMTAAIRRFAPAVPIIDLLSDAPVYNPQAAAYLLAALTRDFPDDAIFLGVVDPGVGGSRAPIVVQASGQWFVGPDNGLFDIVIRQAESDSVKAWRITHQPDSLSASFHGRDLFAPVAGLIAERNTVPGIPIATTDLQATGWPGDLGKIIYIDHFGNAMTGIRAETVASDARMEVLDSVVKRARVFTDVEIGALFWYENANGLVEIAVNQGRADEHGLEIGTPVTVLTPD